MTIIFVVILIIPDIIREEDISAAVVDVDALSYGKYITFDHSVFD